MFKKLFSLLWPALKNAGIGLAEEAAKEGLVDLIEKAEAEHPEETAAFIGATEKFLPVLRKLAARTDTKVDDRAVQFLDELIAKLEENDDVSTNGDESDPNQPPPPGGPGKP